MTPFECLQEAWKPIEAEFMDSAPMRRLANQNLTLAHYAAYLRETYYYTRENPQIQAACTTYFRGRERTLVKTFLHHAISEVGHDALALNDLRFLGFDTSDIPEQKPLPNTLALISFPFYAMQYRSQYSYLGYLYFLEFLPNSLGENILASLRQAWIPETALSFLREHNAVDAHHNKLMIRYANEMLTSSAAREEAIYCMEVTSTLFVNMLDGAFRSIDEARSPLKHVAPNAVE